MRLIALHCTLLRFAVTDSQIGALGACTSRSGLSFFCEMCNSIDGWSPALRKLIEALMLSRSFFQLKTRLLKGVRAELRAAKDSGLTWVVIWRALRDAGYPGAYPNFSGQPPCCCEIISPARRKRSRTSHAHSGRPSGRKRHPTQGFTGVSLTSIAGDSTGGKPWYRNLLPPGTSSR